jgi:hypothetical protein
MAVMVHFNFNGTSSFAEAVKAVTVNKVATRADAQVRPERRSD